MNWSSCSSYSLPEGMENAEVHLTDPETYQKHVLQI